MKGLRTLIADDSYAATFQSMAQYRVALIDLITKLSAPENSDKVARSAEAIAEISAERNRQVAVEGWTLVHDDEHVSGEIAAMAAFYAMPPAAREWPASETGYGETLGKAILPEGWTGKEGDRRRELIKAGALIVAEIERLDRANG